MAENPSPLAEDPSPQKLCSRLFGRDPAADTVPSCPSSLAVVGRPGCPGPLAVQAVRGRPGRPPRLAASPTTAAPWPYANLAWQPHCYAIRTSEWTSTCLRYQAEKRQCSCRRFPAFEPGLQLHGQLPRRKYPPGSLPCRR